MNSGRSILPEAGRWVQGGQSALVGDGGALLAGEEVVCVSVMDWDWPFWTSRQQLMTRFARRNRVLFVDPPPTFASDYLGARRDPRLRKKLTHWTADGGLAKRGDNLLVWTPPPAIPFNRLRSRTAFDGLLAFNQWVFRRALRRVLDRVSFRSPILWLSFNVYFGDAVVGRMGEKLAVYHCTDEVSGFPGYSPYISEIEARLAGRCDLVLSSSEVLRASKAAYNSNSYFVPNAADVELFRQALSWNGPEPKDLLRLPAPRAGFVGQVEYRFDCDLLRHVAERMPSWSFALIGPMQEGNRDVDKLRGLPNVHFLGLKDRESLPGYLAHLDVALIPYKINRLTQGVYPLKLHEYLAAGRPVVATPIPSLKATRGMVYLAADGPSFAQAVERAYVEDDVDLRRRRTEEAAGNSWAARAVEISALLRSALQERAGSTGRETWVLKEPSPQPSPIGRGGTALTMWERVDVKIGPAEPGATIQDYPLSPRAFLRLGRELSLRHGGRAKRLAYRFLGDLNVHRRVRTGHVVATLLASRLKRGEVLDAGCGEGACSLALARALTGCRVVGVDIDAGSVSACRKIAHQLSLADLSFEQADVRDLPYQDRFDAAMCVDMLEHVHEDKQALESLYRALKPGGRLVVHVPLRHQLQRRFIPGFHLHQVGDHVRDEYSREEIVGKVRRAGFEVVSVRTTFGRPGELAFELNYLFSEVPVLKVMAAALTYPFALALAYRELNSSSREGGNSFMVVARKP